MDDKPPKPMGDTPLERLRRWEASGGSWRLLALSSAGAELELCACTGEPMERMVTGDPELLAHLRAVGAEAWGEA